MRIANSRLILILSLVLLFYSCRTDLVPVIKEGKSIHVEKDAVVSAHPFASKAAYSILEKGGNAIDAAIAMQFALAVTYPCAGNIGGGGFAIVHTYKGESYALDFREKAPKLAYPEMYLDENGNPIKNASLIGHLAVGVPGSVDGMVKLFDSLSVLKDWEALLAPAIKLAEHGFPVTDKQAKRFNKYKERIEAVSGPDNPFIKDEPWKKGDTIFQSDLATTLKAISKKGRAGFYEGDVAQLISDDMINNNGMIRKSDLVEYSSEWRRPIRIEYKDHEIISMPPPSSGGIALAQMLSMSNELRTDTLERQSSDHIQRVTEIQRRVYADRAEHLGDPDYFAVPVNKLMDQNYNTSRAQAIDLSSAGKSEVISAGNFKESEETTHFSIIDQEGNAVSITTTLNTGYGSKLIVPGAGFFMNNEMDDFSIKPGVPNYYGLIGNEANKVEAGKRMLSSMTPTIVLKDNKPKIIVGTPGGSTIITSVYQTITNIIDYDLSAYDAIASCRVHHQWLPDLIYLEEDCIDSITRIELRDLGYTLKERDPIGKVEVILIQADGSIEAAGDPRGDDMAVGR